MSEPVHTVYWCPECGYVGFKPDHIDHAAVRWCPTEPELRLLVDPATTREGWVASENPDQMIVYKAPSQFARPVLILPVPVEPKDAS